MKPYKEAKICKGKEWYVYFMYRNPVTKKWKQFKDRGQLGYEKELREKNRHAKELCEAYNERLKAGWSPFGQIEQSTDDYDELKFMPVAKMLTQLLATKKNTIRIRSWQSYKYGIDRFSLWVKTNELQNVAAEYFTENNARAYTDDLLKSGIANKTINWHLATMKVTFNMAVERELVAKNPFRKIKPLAVEVGKNFPFSEVQKKKLKEEILKNDPELWKFVKCIYHLFIRPLELLRLKVSDVDLRTGQMIIPAAASKNKKQMSVEIPESFLEDVKAWKLEQYPAEWFLFGKDLKPSEKCYNRNSVTIRHSEIMKICNIDKKHSMYSWKHTGNVDSYLAGIDVYDIMRQNRHSSLEQTMNYLRSLGLRPNVNFSKKAPSL